MKTRVLLLLFLTALLLLSTGAVTGSAPPRYRIEIGALAGNVRRTAAGAQASAVSAGGAYRLVSRTVSGSASSGCCCTWLPCVLNQK